MNLNECKECEHHIEHVVDSVLCRFTVEIEHRVLSGTTVVACPLDVKKKGLRKFFK